MESKSIQGRWYKPGNPNNSVPGVLEYSPEKGAELTLFDLIGEQNIGSRSRKSLDALFGESIKGENITLRNNVQTSEGMKGGTGWETYRAEELYLGYHVSEFEFSSLEVEYPDIAPWMEERAVKSGLSMDDNTATIEQKAISRPKISISDICDLRVRQKTGVENISTVPSPYERIVFEFIFDSKQEVEKIHEYIRILNDYFALASKPVFPNSVRINYNDSILPNDNIELLYKEPDYVESSINFSDWNFTERDIDLEESLSSWYSHSMGARTFHSMYFSNLYNPDMYYRFKALSLFIGLESYFDYVSDEKYLMEPSEYHDWLDEHIQTISDEFVAKDRLYKLLRSIGFRYSYGDKLKMIIDGYPFFEEIIDIDRVTSLIKNNRHGIVHSTSIDEDDFVEAMYYAQLLAEGILLSAAKLGPDQIIKYFDRNYNNLLSNEG
ncbi:ApeA N-terminal domain 1-containing protein [Natronococcus occultus]|uniref:Uncharacterized protein n=1 Tax=Natronococcus occultus SP4 TaxID=694430 RepID=L0JWF0_9EURY|nr:HEPN domain-containing protein [Natronococcus occultus]AGB36188.1 hypothetical protein Natoc_0318 [Natronococcus occultus SP4]